MKKLIAVLFLVFLLLGCNQKEEKKVVTTVEEPAPAPAVNQLNNYAVFINALDTTKINSVTAAAKEYKRLFEKADTARADSGFVMFSHLYDKMESYLNEQHLKDSTDYTAYVEGIVSNKPKTPKTEDYVKKLKSNGFTLAPVEGTTFIKQDRDFLSGWFYPHISSVMKEYLVQVNKENQEGFTSDAGLVITPLQLSQRVLWWENFTKNHPSFVFMDEIKQKQRGNLTFLLEGIDNTPLFEYTSKKLSENYKKAFENILQNNPQSSTAALIKPYYEALKKKDSKTAADLLKRYKKQGLIYDYSA